MATKKASSKRVVSDAHKAAMATGRESARAVDAYLKALEEFRPTRGRKVSKEDLERRLHAANEQAQQAIGSARLLALQLVSDLDTRIKSLANAATNNLDELEKDFVKSAKAYSESKGINYATWRKVGVPAELLKRAGITRSAK